MKKSSLSRALLDELQECVAFATEKESPEKTCPGSMEALMQAQALQRHEPPF